MFSCSLADLATAVCGTSQLDVYTSTETKDKVFELKLKSLILDLIHNIEVVEVLLGSGIRSAQHWLWQKQLRFYLERDVCIVRMCDAEFHYSYEYQGNAPKLVHTPLTDKCYLTLTQGMRLGFGGNPYGPAGTGKTESVKALGVAIGRQVLVFNCDEGIDFQSMGRIFIGLVKCGAWGCFDEFNRLKEDQLSAISQQIQIIQAAIKNRESTIELLGRTINVTDSAGIFVTMNPAGKGCVPMRPPLPFPPPSPPFLLLLRSLSLIFSACSLSVCVCLFVCARFLVSRVCACFSSATVDAPSCRTTSSSFSAP